ncbi:MAG: HAMP domain-containing sensor histidine kinase [Myxococcaceae bacterium]
MDFLRESSAVAWEAEASSLQLLSVHPGEPWQARISHWLKDGAFVSCCRSVEAGGAPRVEFHTDASKDGQPRSFRTELQRIQRDGESPRLLGISFEVTQAQRTLNEYRHTAEEFEALITNFPDVYFRMSRDGTFLQYRAHDRFELYAPPEVFLGKKITEVMEPALAGMVLEAVQKSIDTGELVTIEYTLSMPTGEKIYEARLVPSKTHTTAFIRNITEQRLAELGRARALVESQQAIRVREEFLSIAAHELNTPLAALRITLEGLLGGQLSRTPEATERALRLADRQTKRLGALVEELLSVSRIQFGRLHLQLEPVDLGCVTRDVIERMSAELSRASCAVDLRCENVTGNWDRLRIEQVVTNLLSNAIKFGSGEPIEVTVTAEDAGARLVVKDHGIGIPPDRISQIFERFERAVSVREYGGLGLGLYIVRQIVTRLGGSIDVHSVPNEGATFTVTLPADGARPQR